MDNRIGQGEAHTAIGGALLVGVLAGLSGGGGLALAAGLTGVAGFVAFLGSALLLASLAVLATIIDGMRQQEATPRERWEREPAGRDRR